MKPRQLVRSILLGDGGPRPAHGSLAVHFCARAAGVSIRDYTTDAAVLADCVCRYYEAFRPDVVWISADTWVTAEAMGARVAFPGPDEPLAGVGRPTVRTLADIEAIPDPDPSSLGRMPLVVEALGRVRERLGDDAFIVGCFDQSPLSLACALAGIDSMMVRVADAEDEAGDAEFVSALLGRCVDHAVAYGAALADAGADMLSTGDSPAGLVGPSLYRRHALPAEQRVFRALRGRTAAFLSLHICGDASGILADMAESGAHVLEIDHAVDLGAACEALGDSVALWGNIDPVGVLLRGTESAVVDAARAALSAASRAGQSRYVLSSGCTLAPATPAANVRVMQRAVEEWGAWRAGEP